MAEVINVEDYRTPCGAAGYLLTWDDGEQTLINAYNSPECTDACDISTCVFDNVSLIECVCGWNEADNRLAFYTAPKPEPIDDLLKDLNELSSIN